MSRRAEKKIIITASRSVVRVTERAYSAPLSGGELSGAFWTNKKHFDLSKTVFGAD
jgi:hypothetical protein